MNLKKNNKNDEIPTFKCTFLSDKISGFVINIIRNLSGNSAINLHRSPLSNYPHD